MPDRSNSTRRDEPRIALVAPENAIRFIERYGSIADPAARAVATSAVQRLLTDQKRLRTRIHALEDSGGANGSQLSAADRDELETLRRDNEDLEARLPKTGEVVLTASDAAIWERLKKLGDVAAVELAVKEYPVLSAEKATNAQVSAAGDAAKALGWNATVLAEVVRDKGYTVEFKTETVDGKPVQVPYIRERDAAKDSAPVKLADLLGTKLAAYKVALESKEAAASNDQSAFAGNRTAGVEYIAQDSGGTAPVGNPADKYISERDKRNAEKTNPLLPKKSN